jgi:hypothetical protein
MADSITMPPAPRGGQYRGFQPFEAEAARILFARGAMPADEMTARRAVKCLARTYCAPRADAARRAERAVAEWREACALHAMRFGGVPPVAYPPHPDDVARATSAALAAGAELPPPIFRFMEPVSHDQATGDSPEFRAHRFALHTLAHPDKRSLPSRYLAWGHGITRTVNRIDTETGKPTVEATGREGAVKVCPWCATHCVHAANHGHTCPVFSKLSVRGTPRAGDAKERARAPVPEFRTYRQAREQWEFSRDAAKRLARWATSIRETAEAELRRRDAAALPIDPAFAADETEREFLESLHRDCETSDSLLRALKRREESENQGYAETTLAACRQWHEKRGLAPPEYLAHAAQWRARTDEFNRARLALSAVIRKVGAGVNSCESAVPADAPPALRVGAPVAPVVHAVHPMPAPPKPKRGQDIPLRQPAAPIAELAPHKVPRLRPVLRLLSPPWHWRQLSMSGSNSTSLEAAFGAL